MALKSKFPGQRHMESIFNASKNIGKYYCQEILGLETYYKPKFQRLSCDNIEKKVISRVALWPTEWR